MKRKIWIPALVAAVSLATAAGVVVAKNTDSENDAVMVLAKAKVSLTQAVGAAEAQAGGRATKAELESERGEVAYQVEVVTADSKVFDVRIDAASGKVVSSKLDTADRAEKDEKDD